MTRLLTEARMDEIRANHKAAAGEPNGPWENADDVTAAVAAFEDRADLLDEVMAAIDRLRAEKAAEIKARLAVERVASDYEAEVHRFRAENARQAETIAKLRAFLAITDEEGFGYAVYTTQYRELREALKESKS